MKNFAHLFASLIALLVVAGCSSPGGKAVVKPEDTELISEMNVPSWYVSLPNEPGSIFSAGTAVAGDIQLANDIAILNAKHVLADRINGRLAAETRSFVTQVNLSADDVTVLSDVERVTINVVDDVDVAGYNVVETVLLRVGDGQYRSYVLLDYSDVEVNKILLNRLKQSSHIRATEAYKRLEDKLDKDSDVDDNRRVIINPLTGSLLPPAGQ